MKKILPSLMIAGAALLLIQCSGNNRQNERLQGFAEKFVGFVNANKLDSIKVYYPTANFDSVKFANFKAIEVPQDTEGPDLRINFGENTWIDITVKEDGTVTIKDSHGIAAFPLVEQDLAFKTGRLEENAPDVKIQEAMNDTAYFAWLRTKGQEGYSNAITVKSLGVERKDTLTDTHSLTMNLEITNQSGHAITGDAYSIDYTVLNKGWKGTLNQPGIDIEGGKTENMVLKSTGTNIINPRAVWNITADEYLTRFYQPTGKEYEEYKK